MASDLSKLIQDSFTLTLNGLLAKDAKILEITKAHIKDIENKQLLKVQSTFEFTNFTSQLSFILPSQSCSLIFNTMMGSPIDDLSDEIDDDSEDAIGEFVSNTSGTLSTSINSENLEDIGQAKFNIASKETIESASLNEIDKLYKYKIDLEDSELIIFILFDDALLPYIEDTAASEVTHHEEEIVEKVEEVEEEPEKVDEIQKDIPLEKESIIKNEKSKETKIIEKKATPKNKKIMIIAGGTFALILILLFIMYLIGIFDTDVEEIKPENSAKTKIIDPNELDVIKYDTIKKVNFKSSEINKERLNKKLLELTKYKVLSQEEIEAQKLAEKNRLFELEKEKQLLAFSKKNQEEPLLIKQEDEKSKISDNKTNTMDSKTVVDKNNNAKSNNEVSNTIEIIPSQTEEEVEESFKYVVTNSLKYSLFKSLVQETNTTQARISICNDDKGKTTIYIGPFETQKLQNKMIELMKNNSIQINAENITEANFNLKCNLE